MLQRELLPSRPIPERLPQEIVDGRTSAMIDDRARSERDRMTRPDRADIQVDVLRGEKPLVEPADLVEDLPAIGKV